MQLDSLVDQYNDLILEALQQHFGLTRDKAVVVLQDFLIQKANSPQLAEALAVPDAIPGQLVLAIKNHAFEYFQTNRTLNAAQEATSETVEEQRSPRFSAMGTSHAETNWALSLIGPAISLAAQNAANPNSWTLFVESRLKPLITAQQRPSIQDLATTLGFQTVEEASAVLANEVQRWNQGIEEQLRISMPTDLPVDQIDNWFIERTALLTEVVQRMVGAGFSESVDQLRCVQELIKNEAEDSQDEAIVHLTTGLSVWEAFLEERIENWDQPRYIYDVGAVFVRRISTPQHSTAGTNTEAQQLNESVDEIIVDLERVLALPLPCDNDLFMSSYLADPNTRHNKGITIGELLVDRYPPEQGLRLLKDVSKQQGADSGDPWHLAVSKLIYFAAIAAFLVRVNSNPAEITSLSFQELSNAFHWAETLPQLPPELKRLFNEAWQTIDMRLN